MPVHLLPVLLVLGTVYFLLLSVSNIIWLRLSYRRPRRTSGGLVSVLVPARDEEANIARCLDSLLEQSYGRYEIVVLDDQSTDRTWEIVSGYAARHPGLVRVVRGRPLPREGWCGKPHAMQQLAEHAAGEYLLFTDADTVHGRDSVSWAVSNLEAHGVDFLSGYVSQELSSFGERLIVPATYIMTTMIMPLWLIPAVRAPGLSFAVGQLVAFRRRAFEAIGGYASVSGQITEDTWVAREVKRAGFRTIFLDVRRHVACRMYQGYRGAFEGISKNLYDYFKNRPVFFTVAVSLLVFFVVLPLGLLLLHLLGGDLPGARLSAVSVGLFQLTWALALYDRGLAWWVPFLYPLLFLHLLYMGWRSFGRVSAGAGVVWKSRVYR